MDKLCVLYVTASNKEEAVKIAKTLVEGKLAACANIYDNVTSVYRWEGKIEQSAEAVLFIKSRRSLFPRIKKAIKAMHSYSCPCVMAMSPQDVNKEYLKWVFSETKK